MSPEKYLQDWQTSQTIAESISPLIGKLYRQKGIEVVLFGKTLINATTIDILKTHRIARRYTGSPLSLEQTMPIIQALCEMSISSCRVDVGQLAGMYWKDHEDTAALNDFLHTALHGARDADSSLAARD
ncbi:glyceraldehyde-3-phosphate dehydrogenase, partial [Vibrio owensii]